MGTLNYYIELYTEKTYSNNMPKTLYIPENATQNGIDITFTPSQSKIDISGWYDSFVGIEGRSLSLRDFLDELGITLNHCKKAFSE